MWTEVMTAFLLIAVLIVSVANFWVLSQIIRLCRDPLLSDEGEYRGREATAGRAGQRSAEHG